MGFMDDDRKVVHELWNLTKNVKTSEVVHEMLRIIFCTKLLNLARQ
jgi:hypothetical protein